MLKKLRPSELAFAVLAFIPIAVCCLLPVLCVIQIYLVDSASQANSLPPVGFTESDLIGTWDGSIETARDSTIIIKEDGRYKQSINIERTKFKYDSDWKSWRVTYSEKGLPYLHLEGFLMCAYWEEIDCRTGSPGFPATERLEW